MGSISDLGEFLQSMNFVEWLLVSLGLIWSVSFIVETVRKFLAMIGVNIKTQQSEDHEAITSLTTRVDSLEKAIKSSEEVHKRSFEEFQASQIEMIKELTVQINKVDDKVGEQCKTEARRTIATFRSSLYRMHSDFTSQGYITREGLKTFIECGKEYTDAGGDDIYHEKLYPEIIALPIKEDGDDDNNNN